MKNIVALLTFIMILTAVLSCDSPYFTKKSDNSTSGSGAYAELTMADVIQNSDNNTRKIMGKMNQTQRMLEEIKKETTQAAGASDEKMMNFLKDEVSIINSRINETGRELKAYVDSSMGGLNELKEIRSDIRGLVESRLNNVIKTVAGMMAVMILVLIVTLLVMRSTVNSLKKQIASLVESEKTSHTASPVAEPAKETYTNGEELETVVEKIGVRYKEVEELRKENQELISTASAVPRPAKSMKDAAAKLAEDVAFLKDAGYPLKAEDYFCLALNYEYKKDYGRASDLFRKAADMDASLAPAWFHAGFCFYMEKKYEKASEMFEAAVNADGTSFDAYFNLGNTYSKMKDYEKAVNAYRNAVALNDSDAAAYNNMAHALYLSDEKEEAVKAYNRAVEIKPDYHEALHNLGIIQSSLGDDKAAEESYTKALSIKEDKHESVYNLACIKAQAGDRDEALNLLERAVELKKDYAAKALSDEDFDSLKDDERFKEITG
ncbi:tetratricopeptide repeat protein [Limisalsivibrio acetivorans]|uniref:tetratricopeptide repeat protein n=1 Tax=Limisalsivibrio acetivorans TaxID=1304888 RepID=UPI0003B67869|nr:tetratricopeptide repeat protein [Limisalsivibrio acetivorans]